jgi:hypothetical protein
MVFRRRLMGAGLLAVLGLSAGSMWAAGPDDAAVYAALLNPVVREAKADKANQTVSLVLHPESLVVERGTSLGPGSVSEILKMLPGADRRAAADLLVKVRKSVPIILPLTALDARLRVIQPLASQIDELFDGRDEAHKSLGNAWDHFNTRFAGATSLVRFSAVGYSARFDEAIFLASIACGGLCGTGALVQVRKSSAGWRIANQRMLWIS